MTCYHRWRENKIALLPGKSVISRLDLATGGFRINLHALIALVSDDQIFGEVRAHQWFTKFQKQELPHTLLISYDFNTKAKSTYFNICRHNYTSQNLQGTKFFLRQVVPNATSIIFAAIWTHTQYAWLTTNALNGFVEALMTKLNTMNLSFTSHTVHALQTPAAKPLREPTVPQKEIL